MIHSTDDFSLEIDSWHDDTEAIVEDGLYQIYVNIQDVGVFYTFARIYSGEGKAMTFFIYDNGYYCYGIIDIVSGKIEYSSILEDGSAAWAAASSIMWKRIE